MKLTWDRIHVWLAAHAPEVLASLRPGATEGQIAAAEGAMGVSLPEDVRACYRIHDGQPEDGALNFLYGWHWFSLAEVTRQFERVRRGVAEEYGDTEVWVPLARGDHSWDYYLLDLTPRAGEDVGQILKWWHDDDPGVDSPSFAHWLQFFAEELEAGEWTTHADWDGLVSVHDVED